MLTSTPWIPVPLLSVTVPQSPGAAQPAAQLVELRFAPAPGKPKPAAGESLTTMLELAALAASASPLVRDATSVIVSGVSYATVAIVLELVPAAIVPVFPVSDPLPLGERLNAVVPTTFAGFPLASWLCTVTENAFPTATVAGTAVIASRAAAPALTVNAVLVPDSVPPVVRVAVIVKEPVLEIVTAREASTPAVNAGVVPPPALSVPVELRSTVPANPVTVLLFASRAVSLTLKLDPAVCVAMLPPPAASTRKLSSASGLTVNALLVPDSVPPVVRVAVIVNEPVLEILTAREASTPALNAGVVPPPEESVPVELRSAVPVKPLTVLLFASRAVSLTLKLVPAVCVAMFPPPAASTRKLFRAPGLTVKLLLVPVWLPAVFVAVIVKEPVLEIVTARDASTPAVKAGVVPPPEESVPVELRSAVPVKPVTVLLFASRAVRRTLKLVPADSAAMLPPPAASTRKLFSAPGLTVNALLVPVSLPAVLVAVIVKEPVLEIVTAREASTPAVKAGVVPLPALSVPVELRSAVPVKPVTVLLFASCAVRRTLKLVPAVCVAMFPPPVASTLKWASAPGLTVNALLVPVSLPAVLVAVMVKEPVLEIVTAREARTPAVKAGVVPLPDDSVPVELRSAVPVNPVTVLLFASRAVSLTLKLVPAVWVAMFPPPAASTRKLFSAPGLTVKLLLVPVSLPAVVVAVAVRLTPDAAAV